MTKRLECMPVLYDGETAERLVKKAIGGKYFQYLLDPSRIIQISGSGRALSADGDRIFAILPLQQNKNYPIKIGDLGYYVEITKEQFRDYSQNPSKLEGTVLVHKNSEMGKRLVEQKP